MKALIIEEKDIKKLFEKLEFEKYKIQGHMKPEDEIYRHFNYTIRSWFQEQGL